MFVNSTIATAAKNMGMIWFAVTIFEAKKPKLYLRCDAIPE